jgi:hypothetical protein
VVGDSHGAEEEALDYMSMSYAANGGNLGMVRLLLERGAPTEPIEASAHPMAAMAVNFDPPLHAAARRGDVEIVRLPLEHGAYPDIQCCSSGTALGIAAAGGHLEVAQLLLEYGADPRLAGHSGTPLARIIHEPKCKKASESLETCCLGTNKRLQGPSACPSLQHSLFCFPG